MLQKVIMRFLQAGPVSQFLRTAALPGGVMLDHAGVHETVHTKADVTKNQVGCWESGGQSSFLIRSWVTLNE